MQGSGIQTPVYLEGLNPEQRQAVMAAGNQPVKVLAGAGTGKTKLIAHRFVKLTDDMRRQGIDHPTERILAVTFTVKAATEMQDRIRQQLQSLASNGNAGSDPGGLSPEHWISNYHGLCLRILRQHAPLLGLSRDFRVLDGMNRYRFSETLIESILKGEYPDIAPILRKTGLAGTIPDGCLTPGTLSDLPVDSPSEYLLGLPRLLQKIKAAGLSPKQFYETAMAQTAAWTDRLKTLSISETSEALNGFAPLDSHVAYCQAWNRDLTDWRDTSWTFMGTPSDKMRFHQEAWDEATRKGKPYDSTDDEAYYLDRVKWLYGVKTGDRKLYVDFTKRPTKARKEPFLPGCLDFSELEALTQAEFRFIAVIAAVYALYQETLKAEAMCDFDDLINHTLTLLSDYPSLRRQYQNRFEAIIVDEFQDSNGSQLELLKLLSRNGGENLTVVGDLKQSIYGFRYAQPENIDLVFGAQTPQTVILKTNYRSAPEIVSVANAMAVEITGDARQQLEACQTNGITQTGGITQAGGITRDEAAVQWITFGASQPDDEKAMAGESLAWDGMAFEACGEGGGKRESIQALKEKEAAWIAAEIERLLQSGAYQARDILILVKNHRKAGILAEALKARKIPVLKQKNREFFQEPLVKDILALFRLMIQPHDNIALSRILQNKLNQRQLRQIARQAQARKVSFYTVLMGIRAQEASEPGETPDSGNEPAYGSGLSPAVRHGLASLAEALSALRQAAHLLSPVQLLLRFSEKGGLLSNEASDDGPESGQEDRQLTALQTLRIFKHLLSQIQYAQSIAGQTSSLLEILTVLEAYRQDPNADIPMIAEDPDLDAVSILTIHAAKGLEKPVVFAAYVEMDRNTGTPHDTRLIFDPQFPGKAGFGVMLGKNITESWGTQTDTLKKQLYQTIWQKPRIEAEQKRLFYVAITRAKMRLYICRADQSAWWTAVSRFEGCPVQEMTV